MKCWVCCVHLILSVALCSQSKSSSVGSFNMKISNTSHAIIVTWEKPDKTKVADCYRTHLQYRSCDSSWQNYSDIKGLTFSLPAPNMKKNYVFRIRMRLQCIQEKWGTWSEEKYWRNDTGLCIAVTVTPFNIKHYLMIAVLPVAGILLICAITQKRVRRHVLPIIPDPMQAPERILNIKNILQLSSFTHVHEECQITEVEVCCEEKTEITADENLDHIQPTHIADGVHDFGLAIDNSKYCVYSPDTPDSNLVIESSQTKSGYIVI